MIKLSATAIGKVFEIPKKTVETWLFNRKKSAKNIDDMVECYNYYKNQSKEAGNDVAGMIERYDREEAAKKKIIRDKFNAKLK